MDIVIIKEPITRAELKKIMEEQLASNSFIHKEAAAGRWFKFSLAEQMGNIGSEVSRAAKAQGKDKKRFQAAIERALELFYLTLVDKRWHGRRQEIARAQDVFLDAVTGGTKYQSDLNSLQSYFDQFAMIAMADFNKKYGF